MVGTTQTGEKVRKVQRFGDKLDRQERHAMGYVDSRYVCVDCGAVTSGPIPFEEHCIKRQHMHRRPRTSAEVSAA